MMNGEVTWKKKQGRALLLPFFVLQIPPRREKEDAFCLITFALNL